ncbi:MAG: hypothetical protein AB7E60_07200 [Sphingobium sp.]
MRRGHCGASSLKFACAASVAALLIGNQALAQDAAAQDASAQAPESEFRFDVMEYVVRGNSVLDAADIQTVLMPHAACRLCQKRAGCGKGPFRAGKHLS